MPRIPLALLGLNEPIQIDEVKAGTGCFYAALLIFPNPPLALSNVNERNVGKVHVASVAGETVGGGLRKVGGLLAARIPGQSTSPFPDIPQADLMVDDLRRTAPAAGACLQAIEVCASARPKGASDESEPQQIP